MNQRAVLLLLLLPLGSALLYTSITHQVWEDYLITVRHSENLVNGHGLVYQPGERVHGFTSVLNTLIPALPMFLTHSPGFSLNFYRACSLGTLLFGLYYLWRSLQSRLGAASIELLAGAFLVGTSVKLIAYSMNGQESGFMVGFLAIGIAATIDVGRPLADRRASDDGAATSAGPTSWRTAGLAWAGLMYTRPDSPLYIAILAGLTLWMRPSSAAPAAKSVLRSAILCGVLYLPWFLFAWYYYGSPVPHTVVAKAADQVFSNGSPLSTLVGISSNYLEVGGDVFGPIYGLGGWPELIGWGAILGGAVASVVWIAPTLDRLARGLSFGLMLIYIYFAWLRIQRDAYPWYFGAPNLMAVVVWGRLAFAHADGPGRRRWAQRFCRAGLVAVAVASAFCFGLSLRQQKIHQAEIEENTRKAIGLYLKEKAAPGEAVFLEPIGYIGYYSGAKILDFPGLVAPEVVAARKANRATFAELPTILKPKWIVARRAEIDKLRTIPDVVAAYEVVHQVNNLEAFDKKYGTFAGSRTLRFDLWYFVLRRKDGL